ncbi:MAG: ATP-binding protein [Marinirhabdus sp.]
MTLLILLASVLIALVTVFQYREEARDYHRERLQRKEGNITAHINYVLEETTYPKTTGNIPLIFQHEIYDIKRIHGLELFLYDLGGNLLKSSRASFLKDTLNQKMKDYALEELKISPDKHFTHQFEENGVQYRSSYTYITDPFFKPLAILNLPYIEDDGFIQKELKENLFRLGIAYTFMFIIAIVLAYFSAKYITRSLKTVSQKITDTRLNKRNEKIDIQTATEEISNLVKAYNGMIDELESSAAQLAASEREAAWREMAKQVAHEIKNPLTPMRLTVQSFQRNFNTQDPDIEHKIEEYSNTLIQQIDTMSSIASAFSNYAEMPAQKDETLNVVKITKLALDIFNESYIYFFSEEETIIATMDRTQLIRVVTNLVKNSIQAIGQRRPETPMIEVTVAKKETFVCIAVKDNGLGISEENKAKVFEPKFTTKNSGMGLGLAMVKNIVGTYGGEITFTSVEGKGTTFKVLLPQLS